MVRIGNLVLLTVMLIGAIITYNMKLDAEKAAAAAVRLQHAVNEQKEAIQLLRAELSMQLQPGRLQAVVERHSDHFNLETLSPAQYATIDEIPLKPIGPPPDEDAIFDLIDDSNQTIQ